MVIIRHEFFQVGALKFFQMLAALGALQLSFNFLSEKHFIFLNNLIFLIGLHTCITYSVQVGMWEGKGRVHWRAILYGVLIAIFLSVPYFFSIDGVSLGLAACVYLIYKFLDRVLFNSYISAGWVRKAYGFSFLAIGVELGVWFFLGGGDNYFSRFFMPASILSLALLFILSTRDKVNIAIDFLYGERIYFALHSFFILMVIMLDRLVVNNQLTGVGVEGAEYLLVFSYGGAIYALLVAVFETKRAYLFEIARASTGVEEYLSRFSFGKIIWALVMLFFLVLALGFLGNLVLDSYGVGISFYSFALLWGGVIFFYFCFFVCVIIHVFYLANRSFLRLFGAWGGGLAIKLLVLFASDLGTVLSINVLSGIVCLTLSCALGWRNAANRIFR